MNPIIIIIIIIVNKHGNYDYHGSINRSMCDYR